MAGDKTSDSTGTSGESTVDQLSFNHPLYLHPSETQGTTIVQHILTGSENYLIWSKAMRIALQGKRKLGFVDGSCKRESQDPTLIEQWKRCDAIVLSWILNSISKELANSIIYYQDAHQVWLELKERFDILTGSRIFTLHREIHSLRQESLTVSTYYSKLKELWEEESSLFPIPS